MRARLALLLPVVFLAACSEQTSPAAPDVTPSFAANAGHGVRLLDRCDPETFNAALGAGACVGRNGGITFENFIALLTKHQQVGSWQIVPGMLTLKPGATVDVTNTGGETHTFTEVEEFGGGLVDQLNTLAGFTEVAEECLLPLQFIAAGQTVPHTFEDEPGVEKYQCCIHPWMQQLVRIKGKE